MTVIEQEKEELHIDASKRPKIAHAFCKHCYPAPPQPGAKALCGMIKKTPPDPAAVNYERCVVCVEIKQCQSCGYGII